MLDFLLFKLHQLENLISITHILIPYECIAYSLSDTLIFPFKSFPFMGFLL